jgi:menaquinone-dependent protoporphyrinogen oxidase
MRVLVTAASRHGGTSDVAQAISQTLYDAGLDVDVIPPDEVASVSDYDAIVLGSAIYYGQWLPSALDLIQRDLEAIVTRPVWLFSVGPLGAPDPQPAEEPPIVAELLERTKAREHRVFAGILDRETLGVAERIIASVVKAPEGDFRDWTAIRHWAEEIASELNLAVA